MPSPCLTAKVLVCEVQSASMDQSCSTLRVCIPSKSFSVPQPAPEEPGLSRTDSFKRKKNKLMFVDGTYQSSITVNAISKWFLSSVTHAETKPLPLRWWSLEGFIQRNGAKKWHFCCRKLSLKKFLCCSCGIWISHANKSCSSCSSQKGPWWMGCLGLEGSC